MKKLDIGTLVSLIRNEEYLQWTVHIVMPRNGKWIVLNEFACIYEDQIGIVIELNADVYMDRNSNSYVTNCTICLFDEVLVTINRSHLKPLGTRELL